MSKSHRSFTTDFKLQVVREVEAGAQLPRAAHPPCTNALIQLN